MCDYSIGAHIATRPAVVDDELIVTQLGSSTGFAPFGESQTAVCLRPGTEIAFAQSVLVRDVLPDPYGWCQSGTLRKIDHQVAIFRQINKADLHKHHDALEFPNGEVVLLTLLHHGQLASILQLPVDPQNETEAKEQERLPVVA